MVNDVGKYPRCLICLMPRSLSCMWDESRGACRLMLLAFSLLAKEAHASPSLHDSCRFEVEHMRHPTLHSSNAVQLKIQHSGSEKISVLEVTGVDAAGHRYTVNPQKLAKDAFRLALVDVIALRDSQSYNFNVTAICGGTTEATKRISFRTSTFAGSPFKKSPTVDPTFVNAPAVVVLQSVPEKIAPGWTWWSNFPGGNLSKLALSRMVDNTGATRWYQDCYTLFNEMWPVLLTAGAECGVTGTQTVLSSGNLLINWNTQFAMVSGEGVSGLVEVTPLGVPLHVWVGSRGIPEDQKQYIPTNTTYLDVQAINHDVQELPNGNWMLIAFDDRLINTTQCPHWPKPMNVSGNEVVEFEPYTGEIVRRWSTYDSLDVCSTYHGPGGWPAPEWIHMNSFSVHNVFAAKKNELIVSAFSPGWVFAVRYKDDAGGKAGSLMWIHGAPRPNQTEEAAWLASVPHFELAGAVEGKNHFQQGQHDITIVDAAGDRLLMFDNGAKTGGKLDAAGSSESRLVEFDISTRPTAATKTATTNITFQYGFGGKAPYLGGARKLPNGNYLGQWGALTDPVCDAPCETDTRDICMHCAVQEVTPAGDLVLSMAVGGRYSGLCYGWTGYRAYRLPPKDLQMAFGQHMSEF